MIIRLAIILLINFGALALGSIFTSKGVPSDWYIGLQKAPWTPPGWLFGVAWTSIMICFSIYLAYLFPTLKDKNFLISLFVIQWILNVVWNPVFFHYHNVLAGMVVISALTTVIAVFLFYYLPELKFKSILILPYLIWLLIASSLNLYILVKN